MANPSLGLTQKPQINVKEITDLYIRTNFQNLSDYFRDQNQLLDFQQFEVQFTGAETDRRVLHGLGKIPRDIVRTSIVGDGVVTFNRAKFDTKFLYISSTGAATIRFFAGTYWKDQGGKLTGDTDSEDWFAKYPSIPGKNGNVATFRRGATVTTEDICLLTSPNDTSNVAMILPDATLNKGRIITFMKVDSNFVFHTVAPQSKQLLDGVADQLQTLWFYRERLQFFCDGTGWWTLDRSFPLSRKPVKSGRTNNGANISSITKIPFNEFFVNAGAVTVGGDAIFYDNTQRRFYTRIPGRYRVTFNGFKNTGEASSRIMIGYNTDTPAAATPASYYGHIYTSNTPYTPQPLDTILNMNAGDYIVYYLMEGALYDQPTDRFNEFNIEWLGPLVD